MVRNWLSEYGLSLEVYGRLWVLVTLRSASSNATGLDRMSGRLSGAACVFAFGGTPGRVGTAGCPAAPLTEPDLRASHPALWINVSPGQTELARDLLWRIGDAPAVVHEPIWPWNQSLGYAFVIPSGCCETRYLAYNRRLRRLAQSWHLASPSAGTESEAASSGRSRSPATCGEHAHHTFGIRSLLIQYKSGNCDPNPKIFIQSFHARP